MEGKLIIKLENLLKEINAGSRSIAEIDDYFEGRSYDDFLRGLPEVDIYSLDYDSQQKYANIYKEIEDWGTKEELKRFADMGFKIFKCGFHVILNRSRAYGFYNSITRLEEAGMNLENIICMSAEYMSNRYYASLSIYDWLYDKINSLDDEAVGRIVNLMEKSVHNGMADEKSLLLIYSIYCSNSEMNETVKKYLINAETIVINILNKFDSRYIDPPDIDTITEFICSDEKYDEKKGNELIKNLKGRVSTRQYYRDIFNSCIFIISNKSTLCNRFIRLMVQYNFKPILNNIEEIIGYKELLNSSEEIGIPQKYIIAWNADKRHDDNFFREKYIKDSAGFKEGIKLSVYITQNYLIKFLENDYEKDEYINILEESVIREVREIFELKKINSEIINESEEFLKGNKEFDSIRDDLYSIKNKADFYRDNSRVLIYTFQSLISLKDYEFLRRTLLLLTAVRENGYINSIYSFSIENINMIINLFEENHMKIDYIMSFIGEYKVYKKENINNFENTAVEFIERNREEIIKNIRNTNPETRMTFLYLFKKYNKDTFIDTAMENFDDKSETVKEYLITLLADSTEYMDRIIEKTLSRKQNERELSIKILKKWINNAGIDADHKNKAYTALKNAFSNEKTVKIKKLFEDIDEFKDICKSELVERKVTDPDEIVRITLKAKNMKSIAWLDFDSLPKVRIKNKEELCQDDVIKAMIFLYRSQNEIKSNEEGNILAQTLNSEDLAVFAESVFERWLKYNSNVKEKWVLPFTSLYGGNLGIDCIKGEIVNWYKNNKIVIAQYGLHALSLIKTKEMLLYFYNYEADCISSAVRRTNNSILFELAEEMKIRTNEIFTKIFLNENDETEIDYGDKKFKIHLNDRACLDIFGENNKKVRGIPKPKEDNNIQKKEYAGYEMLKKNLKKTVKNYMNPLNDENGMLYRNYSKDEWIINFINSPILRRLTSGVIWGVYKEGKAVDTFMRMEDGTFNSIDDDEFDFEGISNDDSTIKAVKKNDIKNEDIEKWKDQISDYEIYKIVKQFE